MREIKFRAWDGKNMMQNHEINGNWLLAGDYAKCWQVMQFTGFKDSNGKEIYEFDIKRETNETDEGDEVLYFICCWIKEWGMFAWLCIDAGEYTKWLHTGANDLDTTMFWTYTLEHSDEDTVCGNIFQNPKLLTPELL